jgi:hypothetical protein
MNKKVKTSRVCRCDSLLFRDLNPAIKIDSPCWNGSDFLSGKPGIELYPRSSQTPIFGSRYKDIDQRRNMQARRQSY